MAHLITGYAGYEHIKSEDDGAFNAAFFGEGQYVMEIGNQLEGSIINNNTVRILDGDGLMYGRHFRIKPNTYEDLTISNGTAGQNRVDLVCMTYKKNSLDETEQVYLEVIEGTATAGVASIPGYTNGNILDGATFNQMPLYKVTVEGVVLRKIEPLFETLKNYKSLAEEYANKFQTSCETHLNSLGILDTLEEVEANTQENQLAGALALKELKNETESSVVQPWQLTYINLNIGTGFTADIITGRSIDDFGLIQVEWWKDSVRATATIGVPRFKECGVELTYVNTVGTQFWCKLEYISDKKVKMTRAANAEGIVAINGLGGIAKY